MVEDYRAVLRNRSARSHLRRGKPGDMSRKPLIAAIIATIALVAGVPEARAAGATVTKVPFRVSSSAQLAIKACVGETVTFTDGQFNVVRLRVGDNFVFHRNVMGGGGTGDTTGTIYNATGHIQAVDVPTSAGGETFTFELTLNVVGVANAGQFTAHALEHLTFTPAGDLTSEVEIDGIRCK